MIRNGCDRLLDEAGALAGKRWALLGHGATVTTTATTTSDLRPLHLALAESAAGRPAALFGPEHGYYGVEQDMVASADENDPWTGAPVLSLYGDDEASLRPNPDAFNGLDVLLIDLQDVGSRYYTYAATAVWAAEAALAAGCEVQVLDRPNPLGGEVVEGGILQTGFESFVGAFHMPVRHGLTLAEIVRHELGEPAGLSFRTMEGWHRGMTWEETGQTWIAPSPNMPTLATARIYPGGCLIEATALSEGRGTTRPFHLVGDPALEDPPALAADLTARIPGATFLPTYFKPQFQKHAGQVCGGVEIVVTDRQLFKPYRAGCELIAAFMRQMPESFGWREAPYEFVADIPAIDLLTGSADFRNLLSTSQNSPEESSLNDLFSSWDAEAEAFRQQRREVLLYPEG